MIILCTILGIGMAIGYLRLIPQRFDRLAGHIVTVGLFFLLFSMGTSLGSNAEVMTNLAQIGYQAVLLAVATVIGSIVCVLFFERYILRSNSASRKSTGAGQETSTATYATGSSLKFTVLIVVAVIIGIVIGVGRWLPAIYFEHLGTVIDVSLNVTIFGIGIGIGGDRSAWLQLRELGIKALYFPLFVAVGSIAGAVAVGWTLHLPFNEAGAVGAGFGWYSLGGVLLTKLHSAELGALSFLTNVCRELMAIISMPLLAKYQSHLVALSTGGATTMDSTLPIIARATNGELTTLALVSGFILTLLVPVLVPFLIQL